MAYRIIGMTDDLSVVQKAVANSFNKKNKPQKVIAKQHCCWQSI